MIQCSDDPPHIGSRFTIVVALSQLQLRPDEYPLDEPAKFFHVCPQRSQSTSLGHRATHLSPP